MTRFTERVERDLGQIADRATPSSTAWETIQHRIDEQTATAPTTEFIMLSPDRNESPTRRRRPLMVAAVVAVLALVVGLIIAATRVDEDLVPADEPVPTLPAEPEPATESESVEPLPFPGQAVEAERYEASQMGVPMTFDVPEPMALWATAANWIFMIDSEADSRTKRPERTARELSFSRIAGWNDRAQAGDGAYVGSGSIDPYDVEAWIAGNDVIVDRKTTTTVAGRSTTVLDVRVDPTSTTAQSNYNCTEGEVCFWAASRSGRTPGQGARLNEPAVSTGRINRFWLITIDGHDPLLVHAAAVTGDEAWLDTVDATTIATLQLGDDAPPFPVD